MDDLWYSELHTPTARFSIKVKQQLHFEKSDFQTIDVFDSDEFGRFLTLDGMMMLTERDEFIYHEMITHPAMAVNPDIRRVLVIGAGDGGVVRELSKYPLIETIDVVEIDARVVEVCREYLPQTACGFDDPRVNLHIQDGLKFVRHKESAYDLIIVDSTDPFGPGGSAVHQGVLRQLPEGAEGRGHPGQPERKPLLQGGHAGHAVGAPAHRAGLPGERSLPGPYPDLSLRPLAVRLRVQRACTRWRT